MDSQLHDLLHLSLKSSPLKETLLQGRTRINAVIIHIVTEQELYEYIRTVQRFKIELVSND